MKIDWKALDDALSMLDDQSAAYLDLQTGEVLEWRDFSDIGQSDDEVLARVEAEPDRYAELPDTESRERFAWMEAFAATVSNARLRERLEDALRRDRPFRRFKDALLDAGAERERWFTFEADRRGEHLERWLSRLGVVVDNPRSPTLRLVAAPSNRRA